MDFLLQVLVVWYCRKANCEKVFVANSSDRYAGLNKLLSIVFVSCQVI